MKTLGIDSSTFIGLAWADGQDMVGKLLHLPKARGWQRVQLIAMNFERTVSIWAPDLAIIEDYALGMTKSAQTIITQVEIGTVLRSCLATAGVPWLEVRPSTLKKWTTGRGDAKKPDMAVAARERWGFASSSDDVVDAVALAQFGQQLGADGLGHLPEGVRYGHGTF